MRGAVAPLRINHASADPRFAEHPGLSLYGIESYIAVPLVRRDGSAFGTLCALDPLPTELTDDAFTIFHLLAQLIAFELEADERQRRREAEIHTLEDFVAIAAHDLRQPLTALHGRLQMLARAARRGLPAAEMTPKVDALLDQSARAIALTDTLLDVARFETGGLELDRQPLDLVALAMQAIEDVQTTAPDHAFRLDAPDTFALRADARRLSRVLHNLLENAAKYAPAEGGPIVVTIEPDALADGTPAARLAVHDSGDGIPAEALHRIFERQYRVPGAMTEAKRGSGLGLYIVRQIVEAHGGSVRAENAPDAGLQVVALLPLRSE